MGAVVAGDRRGRAALYLRGSSEYQRPMPSLLRGRWQDPDLQQHSMSGLWSLNPRSVAGLLLNECIFCASPRELLLEVIEKLKRRFRAATNALDACDREYRMSPGSRPTLLVYRVICSDEDAMHWPAEDIGNLRVALNALVRVFRM